MAGPTALGSEASGGGGRGGGQLERRAGGQADADGSEGAAAGERTCGLSDQLEARLNALDARRCDSMCYTQGIPSQCSVCIFCDRLDQ